jgi:acetoin utilization protein AcuB
MVLVSDWMVVEPRFVSPDTPVLEAEWIMDDGNFRHLPVVRKDRLVGIVSDRDLRGVTAPSATTLSRYELNYLVSRTTVDRVMNAPVITVSPDDRIEDAALKMVEHKISALPVVDDERLVGILTITDLMHALVDRLSNEELTAG